MGILSWILVGLVAGLIAKWIIPNRRHKGIIRTLVLGVVGGLLGGFIGRNFDLGFGQMTGIDLNSIVTATLGAISILILQRLFADK